MGEEILYIEKLVFGGLGLGRLTNGMVVFVPYVIPGEKVKVKIISQAKDFAEALPVEIISASPSRVDPPCPYYTVCGGCQLQHIDYQRQVELKKEILFDLFKRNAGLSEIPLLGVYPSPKTFGYRNRLRLHVETMQAEIKLGFVKWRSKEVLRIDRCLLAHDLLNSALSSIYHHPTFKVLSPYLKRVRFEYSPVEDRITLLFWTMVTPFEKDLEALLSISELKAVFYLLRGQRPNGPYPPEAFHGGRRIFKALHDLLYFVQPGVFVQTNWEVNLIIQEKILELSSKCERVLDLHCGMGNLVLPLVVGLLEGREFLGVDTDPRAIEDGLYTAKMNDLGGRLDLRTVSSHASLRELIREGRTFDLVILDPPRGGCKDILKLLPQVAEKNLLYLSCDPPTLARDVKLLMDLGYHLEGLYLFDMFPQSYHLEVLAHLVKKF